MKVIYKYDLEDAKNTQVINMPKGSRVLKVAYLDAGPKADPQQALCLWALVPLENTQEPRLVTIAGTGQNLKAGADWGEYIDTVFNGPYVWHVFVN